jgi:cobalamin synthase
LTGRILTILGYRHAAGSCARFQLRHGVLLVALRPARVDGLSAGLRELNASRAIVGLAMAGGSLAAAANRRRFVRMAEALLAALVIARIVLRRISGYTGDVFSATSEATECVAIGLLSGLLVNG